MTSTPNPLPALEAAELAAAAAPVLTALANIKNGDGSVASITGQGLALEGNVISILPILQKIGVQNIAGYFIDLINEKLADAAPAAAVPATPAPAAA